MIDFDLFWSQIPIGKENAIDYTALCNMWDCNERTARLILHELSSIDNGDDYILIRSGKNKGFYRTDNQEEIEMYRREVLSKGRSIFAPVRKCNRILRKDDTQLVMDLGLL